MPDVKGSAKADFIQRSIRGHLVLASGAMLLVFGGLGGWAATTELSGAVLASGQLVVHSNVKKVQHPTGGVVGELKVRDGDRVRAGDVVARLDDTVTRANLAIVVNSLNELYVRRARLEAERDNAQDLTVPAELAGQLESPAVARIYAASADLLRVRRTAREGQKSQLVERRQRLREEIKGLDNQIGAKNKELGLIYKELKPVQELLAKKLIQVQRVIELERSAARLEGEHGQLTAAIAQAQGSINEVELQILQIDQDLRAEVGKELSEVQEKIDEFAERKIAAQDQLQRIDLRAPQGGVIHQLAVHTIGGVIAAGEAIMLIVPDSDDLLVEAKIAPGDIDQVEVGQPARLRLSAFNQGTTPETSGKIVFISPDLLVESRSGASYFTVRILIDAMSAGAANLVPGMPVEAFIQTESRSVLSYLVKPLVDQVARAFRES